MMSVRSFLLLAAVGCGGGGGFPDARDDSAPPPGGTFTVDWSLLNASGQPITCDDIGAISMTALLRNRGVQGGSTEVFNCNTQMGTSPPLVPGTYDITFELNGISGAIPTPTPLGQTGIEITSGGDVRLAPLAFMVNATGGLKLNFATNKPGGNCAGGAAITATTVTLQHVGSGACEAVMFSISAGASGIAGMYTVNCATPMTTGCIESDQLLTATGVPSGSYQIHVRGKSGNDCWINNDQLPVPPVGRDLTRSLNLTAQLGMPSC